MREILFRGKRPEDGEWIYGIPAECESYKLIISNRIMDFEEDFCQPEYWWPVEPETIGQYTGLTDKNGTKIFEGDVTLLVVDGDVRKFVVTIKDVDREMVTHQGFDDTTAHVQITGVFFVWDGYELLPCIDDSGVSDVSRMEIVGNIYDNPEILQY